MTVDDGPLQHWQVRARNLPEHADNPVHTDAGARAAGFPRALVAGVTIYAYLTHVPAAGWGDGWLAGGQGEVRFLSPVFDHDIVDCIPVPSGEGAGGTESARVEASVGGVVKATFAVSPVADPEPARSGERLDSIVIPLDHALGTYGVRAGDDLARYAGGRWVHPSVWPVIGNRVTMANLVTGPWVHVRSKVRHLGVAEIGSHALVESTIIDRFSTRSGDRAVLDVRVSVDDVPVAAIEHESIIRLSAG